MIKLERTTKNGDKVMAHTIMKAYSLTIDALVDYAKVENIKIKSAQHILTLDEANTLVTYIQRQKQVLYFDSKDWHSCTNINDYQNLITFINNTLKTIDEQIEQNSKILENSNNAYKVLQQLTMNNDALKQIQIYLLSKFDFSLEHLKDKLILMKSEALEYLDTIDNSTSIWNDEILSQKKINFNFTATKIVRLYEEQMHKITHYASTDAFFTHLLEAVRFLQKTDDKFQTTDKEKLLLVCKESYLEEYSTTLYEEWKNEIDKINKFYLKFIKAYFIDKISENLLIEIFTILYSIKEELEAFFLTVRLGLMTKYKENPKSNLLQEIATKDRLFKIYQNAQPKLIVLLKNETSQVAYRFINTVLSDLLSFKIEEKSKGYENIYDKMIQLHATNLEIYLNDMVIYGKELEKRDMEISKLMFKMKTDLEKKGV